MIDKLSAIPKDKLLHSFYGCLIYAVVAYVSPWLAIGVVVVAAVGKEIYDERSYGGFDWVDIAYTVAIPLLLLGSNL